MSAAPQDPDTRTTRTPDAARRPRKVLLGAVLVLLAWLVVGGLGGAAQGKLSGVQSNDNATFLPQNAESTLVSEAVARFSDSTELPYLVVVERTDGGALSADDLAALQQFADGVPDLPLTALGSGKTLGDYLVQGRPITPVPAQDGQAALVSVPLDGATGTEAAGDTTALAEGAAALREAIDRTLAPAGLTAYVGGPGGLIADFSAAFAGIDGILLGVALLVVLVILLIVYRSPILPFAVLLSAVFGLSARLARRLPAGEQRRHHALGPVTGHPLHPRRRCRDRLRPAARQPLQGGAARRGELVGGAQAGLARRGRADRRVGRDGHPRPALPAARRAPQHLGPRPGRCPRHRRCPARLADLPPGRAAALRAQGLLAVRARRSTTSTPRTSSGSTTGIWGRVANLVGHPPPPHLGAHPRRAARGRGVRRRPSRRAARRSRRPSSPTSTRSPRSRSSPSTSPAGAAQPLQVVVPEAESAGGARPRDPGPGHRERLPRARPAAAGRGPRPAEGRRRHGPRSRRRPTDAADSAGGRGHRRAGCAPTSTP